MLSNNQFKLFKSLKSKKGRAEQGAFLVEGNKSVQEVLQSDLEVVRVMKTANHSMLTETNALEISDQQMQALSSLATPPGLIAVVKFPSWYGKKADKSDFASAEFVLVLDGIRDPGNLGTIIRTADWFGHQQLLLSADCVDCFNPKVVQSSMGSVFRLECLYGDLDEILSEQTSHALDLSGENIYQQNSLKGFYVIGSESHGVRVETTAKLTIPGSGNAESLNAAISASILLSKQFELNQ